MDRKHLEWVQQNRERKPRWRPVGELFGAMLSRVGNRLEALSSDEKRRLTELVDADFQAHARIGELRGGVLQIYVDDASLAYLLRARWTTTLERAMPSIGRKDIGRVRIVYGDVGAKLQ